MPAGPEPMTMSRTTASLCQNGVTAREIVTPRVTWNPMTVKRAYSSDLRADQARRTRRQIVDAASALFTEHGFSATTVDAIAAEAGVSRKTVFTAVGGKVQLLK